MWLFGYRVAALTCRSWRRSSALVLGALVAACNTVQVRYPDGTTAYQDREAFAAYVEQVFRYHNRVVDDLIMVTALGAAAETEPHHALVAAERAMSHSCQPLNDAVAARIEGRKLGLFETLALPAAVPACEAASRRLATLIPAI